MTETAAASKSCLGNQLGWLITAWKFLPCLPIMANKLPLLRSEDPSFIMIKKLKRLQNNIHWSVFNWNNILGNSFLLHTKTSLCSHEPKYNDPGLLPATALCTKASHPSSLAQVFSFSSCLPVYCVHSHAMQRLFHSLFETSHLEAALFQFSNSLLPCFGWRRSIRCVCVRVRMRACTSVHAHVHTWEYV